VNGTLDPGTETPLEPAKLCHPSVPIAPPQYTASHRRMFGTTGILMQWMDAAACMSAERHAKRSSVTACMDGEFSWVFIFTLHETRYYIPR